MNDADIAHNIARMTEGRDQGASESDIEMLGDCPAMQQLQHMIDRVARTDATILITGESGSGKEVAARTLHQRSKRACQPFLAINCAAIPETLIEAELFGHEKGSFTGAIRTHQGVFERGRGGTLLLDEISEMPFSMQARLLRVLQTGSFFRVGGTREISSDVRVIAATNSDLVAAVAAREFRADVFYRLAVFPIHVPPLRSRGGDILLLAQHFLDQLNAASGQHIRFAPQTEEFLLAHQWPGNVRELRNCVERGFIMSDSAEIRFASWMLLPLDVRPEADGTCIPIRVGSCLADAERRLIIATLNELGGNKRRAARMLGCSVKTLYNKLHQYDVHDESAGTEFG